MDVMFRLALHPWDFSAGEGKRPTHVEPDGRLYEPESWAFDLLHDRPSFCGKELKKWNEPIEWLKLFKLGFATDGVTVIDDEDDALHDEDDALQDERSKEHERDQDTEELFNDGPNDDDDDDDDDDDPRDLMSDDDDDPRDLMSDDEMVKEWEIHFD